MNAETLPATATIAPIAQMPQQVPMVIERLSALVQSDQVNVDTLDKLLELQLKVMAHQAKMEYMAAKSKLASIRQIIPVNRRGEGPGGSTYTYGDLPQFQKWADPWCAECGLGYDWRTEQETKDDEGLPLSAMVICVISHYSGHQDEYPMYARRDDRLASKLSPMQSYQIAITYAKRQTLKMGLGLVDSEDACDEDNPLPALPNQNRQRPQSQNSSPSSAGGKQKDQDGPAHANAIKTIRNAMENRGINEADILKRFKLKKLEDLKASQVNDVLNWMKNPE